MQKFEDERGNLFKKYQPAVEEETKSENSLVTILRATIKALKVIVQLQFNAERNNEDSASSQEDSRETMKSLSRLSKLRWEVHQIRSQ